MPATILLNPLDFGRGFFHENGVIARVGWLTALAWFLLLVAARPAQAEAPLPHIRLGTQEVGFTAGPILPWRVKPAQSTKLFGAGAMPSWSLTLTPIRSAAGGTKDNSASGPNSFFCSEPGLSGGCARCRRLARSRTAAPRTQEGPLF